MQFWLWYAGLSSRLPPSLSFSIKQFEDDMFLLHIVTVFIFPSDNVVVSTLGGNTSLSCASSLGTVNSVEWLINGTAVPRDENIVLYFNKIDGIGTLKFTNLALEYNNSRVKCQASFGSEGVVTSSATLLLLQG